MDEPLTIYGTGANTRSFQYVSDLIRGLIALMASDYSMPVTFQQSAVTLLKSRIDTVFCCVLSCR